MSLTTSEMTPADIAAVTGGNRGNCGGWGGNWESFIILFLIFGMFGWGGFGGGFGGGGFGGQQGYDTRADIQRGFDNSAVITKLDGITQGICSLGYDQLNQMNGINTTVMQTGFGLQNAIQQNSIANMQGFNGVDKAICGVQSQIADCCCGVQRAIDGVNYNMLSNANAIQNIVQNATRDIIDNANSNTRAVLDQYCQDKISTLQQENQSLRLERAISNQNAVFGAKVDASTAEILRRTGSDCPVAAYVVPNPNCCYGNPIGVGGYNNGNCGGSCGGYGYAA